MSERGEYLDSVCRQVRFRAARKYVRQELGAHIDDKQAELVVGGVTDAEAAAIKAMGDPVETGRALNAIHRPRVEWGVVACVLLLIVAGLVADYAGITYGHFHTRKSFFRALDAYLELKPATVSFVAMVMLMFVNYTWLFRLRHVCFGVGIAYIAFYVTFYMIDPYGQTYLWFGRRLFSPTAVTVIPAILFLLSMVGFAHRCKHWSAWDMALLLGLGVVSILAEHLVSTDYSLLLAVAELAILLVALSSSPLGRAQKWRYGLICIVVLILPAIFGRAVVDQFIDGYQSIGVRSMLRGALFVGPSPLYLAYPQSYDVYFPSGATVLVSGISAYGWLFGIGVIGLFAALLVLMVRRSLQMAYSFGRLLSLGICAWFGVRFVLFTLINLGLVSSISSDLPFVSSGSFNYLTDALFAGMFLSVWRRSSFMPRDAVPVMPAAASVPAQPAS